MLQHSSTPPGCLSVNHQSAHLADVKSTLHHLQHFIWLYEISGSLEKRGEGEASAESSVQVVCTNEGAVSHVMRNTALMSICAEKTTENHHPVIK
ncbi:hypothetical protein ROHU_020896 [Labeo rohita]|uniref:Uncharacterized protein n=1 Tax=Labeo rohita TaxID=84645 RepID=A0A498NBY0_LABRO|nr:hypothetical protein ROHU_020896 [Labeo rohita]